MTRFKQYIERRPYMAKYVALGSIMMGVALQVQPNITLTGHSIRASLSDLILIPFLLFPILVFRQAPRLLPWPSIIWAAGLCGAIAIAYANGVISMGAPTSWATIKLAGAFLLLSYFLIGAAMAVLGGRRAQDLFVASFATLMATLVLFYFAITLLPAISTDFIGVGWRFTGLISNPNAAGLALNLAFVLAVTHTHYFDCILPKGTSLLLLVLLTLGLILTTSSAAWGAAGISTLLLVFLKQIKILRLLMVVAISSLLATGLMFSKNVNPAALPFQVILSLQKVKMASNVIWKKIGLGSSSKEVNSKYGKPAFLASIGPRAATNLAALRMWQAAPVFGKGLGYFLESQRETKIFGAVAFQVHNTWLWLLAETGIVGLFAFIGFVGFSMLELSRKISYSRRFNGTQPANFAIALLVFCIAWQIMSLAHELMYQRYVWFALGMALAGSPNKKA